MYRLHYDPLPFTVAGINNLLYYIYNSAVHVFITKVAQDVKLT